MLLLAEAEVWEGRGRLDCTDDLFEKSMIFQNTSCVLSFIEQFKF
jgi:hypothetical protein